MTMPACYFSEVGWCCDFVMLLEDIAPSRMLTTHDEARPGSLGTCYNSNANANSHHPGREAHPGSLGARYDSNAYAYY